MGEWYEAHRGRVPALMAGALAQAMKVNGITFPEAYALLVGRGTIVEIPEDVEGGPADESSRCRNACKSEEILVSENGGDRVLYLP